MRHLVLAITIVAFITAYSTTLISCKTTGSTKSGSEEIGSSSKKGGHSMSRKVGNGGDGDGGDGAGGGGDGGGGGD